MSKRSAEDAYESGGKRQRLEGPKAPEDVTEIRSAQQLEQLLAFQQDAIPQLRTGIRAFKVFLESIVYAQDKSSTTKQQVILRNFLDSQQSPSAEEPCLPSLMQTWSFAAQINHDSLISAVSSVLALLFKTISGLINLRDHGLTLGRTLLQQAQLKLIARGLSAPRPKEHIISPCLRLLTEIVAFDGGVLAKQAYSVRSFTLDPKILSRNLSFSKATSQDSEEARRRPAVRTTAIRYLIANLTFQPSSIKAELLKYSNVFRALFEHVKQDPVDVLSELLTAFKTNILQDESLQRQSKSFVLHDGNLSNIASLYRREHASNIDLANKQSDQLAHDFLTFVCTEPSAGLLRASSWYPPGTEHSSEEQHQTSEHADIDLGLDSVEWYNRFHSKVPVRNGTLAKFVQGLRPYANLLESELLINIFKAAPELVAHYFIEKSTIAFDPKLTATWIGYAAFLYSAAELPVPSKMGSVSDYGRVPPPVSIMLENILPSALTQQVLTRCLNQKVELITFFTIRLLALVLQKLQVVTTRLQRAARESGSLWQDASTRLANLFLARFPKMKDIITIWKSTSTTNEVQQEAILRLIRLCYQVIPQSALEERFDVSLALNEALARSNEVYKSASPVSGTNDSKLQILQLNHLLQISRHTPDMRWFSKPSSRSLSPCGSLLKILAMTPLGPIFMDMRKLLGAIVNDNSLLQSQTVPSGLDALLTSLTRFKEEPSPPDIIFEFLDDVFERTCKKPIKYEDDMKQMIESCLGQTSSAIKPNSLIWSTILEQWPFVVTRDVKAASTLALWLNRFSAASRIAGEDPNLHQHYVSQLNDGLPATDRLLSIDSDTSAELQIRMSSSRLSSLPDSHIQKAASAKSPELKIDPKSLAPLPEDRSHRGLHLWSSYPDIPAAISFDTLPPLITCLSSSYPEVRSQSLINVRIIMARIQPLLVSATEASKDPFSGTTTSSLAGKSTSFSDATPIYLLLGILSNTATQYFHREDPQSPLPGIATSYAAAAAKVLLDPLHPVYDKVNAFHTRAPKWDISRMASYWISKVLLESPSEDLSMSLTSSSSRGFGNTSKEAHNSPDAGGNLAAVRLQQEDAAMTPYAAAAHNEIHFLLCVLLGSLHSPGDVEILRSRGSFEPLFALLTGGNGFVLPLGLRELVLKVLWRVVLIEGGATTLITRCGLLALITGLLPRLQKQAEPQTKVGHELWSEPGLRALAKCAWENCDQARVMEWGVRIKETVCELAGVQDL